VLAGGAARGAYEVGVLDHIVEHVSKDLGYDVPLDILSGTSVGAVNACALAAWADEPKARVGRLVSEWTGLRISEVVRPTTSSVMGTLRSVIGGNFSARDAAALFNPRALEHLLRRVIAFRRIDANLRAGHLSAVTVSATQIATGRIVVFVQRRNARPAPWPATHNVIPRAVRLRMCHALASAALPVMFPPVRIDGRFYCDGGLRQNIPLSPARRLGAEALIVINPKFRDPKRRQPPVALRKAEGIPNVLALLGKVLNTMLLDRVDNELDRMEKINSILTAGERRFGDTFLAELNDELGRHDERRLVNLNTIHIRPSENIGELSADYVRSPEFHVPGVLGRVMKRLAEGEALREADLLSYVLFDGEFAGRLIELGRADGRRHHDELCATFEPPSL
jgi:NTE family protein